MTLSLNAKASAQTCAELFPTILKITSANKNLTWGSALKIEDNKHSYQGLFAGASKSSIYVIDSHERFFQIPKILLDSTRISMEETLPDKVFCQNRGDCQTRALINSIERHDQLNGIQRKFSEKTINEIYEFLKGKSLIQTVSETKSLLAQYGINSTTSMSLNSLINHLSLDKPAIIFSPVRTTVGQFIQLNSNQLVTESKKIFSPTPTYSAEIGHVVTAYGAVVKKRNLLGPQEGYVVVADTAHPGRITFYKISDLKRIWLNRAFILLGAD